MNSASPLDLGKHGTCLVRLPTGRQRIGEHHQIKRRAVGKPHGIAERGDRLVGLSGLRADETVREGAVCRARLQVTKTAAVGQRVVHSSRQIEDPAPVATNGHRARIEPASDIAHGECLVEPALRRELHRVPDVEHRAARIELDGTCQLGFPPLPVVLVPPVVHAERRRALRPATGRAPAPSLPPRTPRGKCRAAARPSSRRPVEMRVGERRVGAAKVGSRAIAAR